MTTKEWLDLVKQKPVAFGLEAGFSDLRDIHNNWIKDFLFSREDLTLQAHRGSYKTTCIAVAMALMLVIYPDNNLIFLRKSDDDVKEIIVQVVRLLRTDMFNALAQGLYGTNLGLVKESAFEIDTNLKTGPKGASQLIGLGSKASITGKHADIIVTDDIVNIDDRISKAHRDRTKLTYQELQNIKNRGGRFINCGTPWHKEDAFSLMPNLQKYDCYSTGLIEPAQLQALRNSMTPSLFAANYELQHIADEETIFNAPVIDDGSNTEKIYNGMCHLDAAYGGSDSTAFTVANWCDGKLYVYGMLRNQHVDDLLGEIEARREQYKAGTIYCELNADKGYLLNRLEKPRRGYHEKQNKFIKISTYLREVWDKVVFLDSTDKAYINEILDYTERAEHDDAPDSLASLVRELARNRGPVDVDVTISAFRSLGL
ncbi:MAG: terminase family protein [Eubacteriales bacterium]|nr:terminase family protein [Eubacteriales bacterium]